MNIKIICQNPPLNTIPCDICGEDYLPHMLNTNSFPSQLTCESCDAEIARDEEMLSMKTVFDAEHCEGDWD